MNSIGIWAEDIAKCCTRFLSLSTAVEDITYIYHDGKTGVMGKFYLLNACIIWNLSLFVFFVGLYASFNLITKDNQAKTKNLLVAPYCSPCIFEGCFSNNTNANDEWTISCCYDAKKIDTIKCWQLMYDRFLYLLSWNIWHCIFS